MLLPSLARSFYQRFPKGGCTARACSFLVNSINRVQFRKSPIDPQNGLQKRTFFSTVKLLEQKDLIAVGQDLIPVINKLQEIFAITGSNIDLPQIIVIGGQSSGKSSVLENLVGRDFLPRGSGIVTRRPLILQLQPLPPGEKEYGQFLHKPGDIFYDFGKIKEEIVAETEKVAGANKGISNKPILLKIFSPRVLPLTLVDTPGIARVAVGDQPSNIEDQIRSLISDYIYKPKAIILAVHAGNQDLATSDALYMAKMADPEGNRTLGVLTKIDLMDKGTDALSIFLGRSFPLRRGWTAVVNRSQYQIDQELTIEEAQKLETNYFMNHPIYKTIADRCGSKVLAEKCNKMLQEHIKWTLQDLRKQISDLTKQRERELEKYGAPLSDDESKQGWYLLQQLNKFASQYREAIIPMSIDPSNQIVTLSGGARIRFILKERLSKKLDELNPDSGLSTRDIQTVIKNASGTRSALFVPDKAFEVLAKQQIKWLREPCLQAAESIYNELLLIITEIENPDLMRFWKLRDAVCEVAGDLLQKALKETQGMINTAIDLELSYINTSHPDFSGLNLINMPKDNPETEDFNDLNDFENETHQQSTGKKIEKPSYEEVLNRITNREMTQISIIRQLLSSYFNIVRKNVQDQVTKIIMMSIVKNSVNDMQRELVSKLYKGDGSYSGDLLVEAGDVVIKRKLCREELEALRKAKKVIQMSEIMELQ